MNYQIRIDVTKIDKESLYKGEKGTYMTLDVLEVKNSKYGNTHMVKQVLSKEKYQSLSDEQKKQIPILGNMAPSKFQHVQTVVAEEVKQPTTGTPLPVQPQQVSNDSGLPF